MVGVLMAQKGVVFVNLSPGQGDISKSQTLYRNAKKSECSLWLSSPEITLVHENTRPHASVEKRDGHRLRVISAATSILQCCPHTVRFSPNRTFKPARTTQGPWLWKSNLCQAGKHALGRSWNNTDKNGDYSEK